MNATASIVSKVWSFCTTLRDDGVGYGDYLEQLTYLIFLKMADEYSQPPHNRKVGIPAEYNWQSLKAKRGAELEGKTGKRVVSSENYLPPARKKLVKKLGKKT